jgi:L-aspartate oxidase
MRTDALVIGAGLAGLACALGLRGRSVVLVNDTNPEADVASAWAQGGLAAALGDDDTPELHAIDTLAAAAGIADERIVRDLTGDAPAAIALLERFGVPFDRRADGSLALGLEAAHSRRRIVHAADHTGASIVRSLLDVVAERSHITLATGLRSIELLRADDGRIAGALFIDRAGQIVRVNAPAVVLASGGYGGLFAKTTTPPATLGAGIALAGRAGATLADLEFVQFHPTALASTADPMALISEAVRGEGAVLVDDLGERFVDELAPRDIVARAIFALEERGGRAFLDARAALGPAFPKRFPTIAARCMAIGIDPTRTPIPVTPAAHYTIGGIVTDAAGRTNVAGLWACGEVAATGLHGANRLASNSLMEALIFGGRAARDISAQPLPLARGPGASAVLTGGAVSLVPDLTLALAPLRTAMSSLVGVVRDEAGLSRAIEACDELRRAAACADPRVRDAVVVAYAVASAALARRESRGTHFRRDFPAADMRLSSRSFSSAPQARLAEIS